jgi:hypothetical protein
VTVTRIWKLDLLSPPAVTRLVLSSALSSKFAVYIQR